MPTLLPTPEELEVEDEDEAIAMLDGVLLWLHDIRKDAGLLHKVGCWVSVERKMLQLAEDAGFVEKLGEKQKRTCQDPLCLTLHSHQPYRLTQFGMLHLNELNEAKPILWN